MQTTATSNFPGEITGNADVFGIDCGRDRRAFGNEQRAITRYVAFEVPLDTNVTLGAKRSFEVRVSVEQACRFER
jgi:hypothetical protein